MTNSEAVEATLEQLKSAGRLEMVDSARVEAVRSMASELDRRSSNAQLWKTYVMALERLIFTERDSDDALRKAWAELNAGVGNQTQT